METLTRLERFDVSGNEKWKAAVERFARSQRGEEGYFELVEQFSIKAELPELLRLVQENASGGQAGKAYLIFGGSLGASREVSLADADWHFIGEQGGGECAFPGLKQS